MSRRRIPLSQIADIAGGYAFKSEDFTETGFPVVKIASIQPPAVNLKACERIPPEKIAGLDRFRLQDRDIVMAMTGATIGKVGRIRSRETAYLNQRVAKISAKAGREFDDFIFAILSQAGFDQEVLNNANGSAQANVSTDGIGRILIPEFSPKEQFQIGRILGTLDDKIELNRRMNETLEAIAQAIFKSWFVDFDPVRAKAGSEPAGSICRRLGLTSDILALFPDSFQDSKLGEIPARWQIATVSALAAINAWTLSKNDELDLIEYVEISEVSHGNIGAIQVFKRGEEPSRARRRLRHGDTGLSTVRPERGSYFLCLNPSSNLIASTGFAIITPISAPWSVLHAALTLPEVFEHLGTQADGGAYPAIRPEMIENLRVVCPDKPALFDAFHRACAPLYERADHNRRESRTLVSLRNVLLPKLLSGELRVPSEGAA